VAVCDQLSRVADAGKALAAGRVAGSSLWSRGGHRSAAHWMAKVCGISVGDAVRMLDLAETVAEQAVSTMKEWIEAPHSLQNIILVGGGAFLFRKAVKAAFPKHRIHEVKEPMFANVRGFQLAGQNYASSKMTATGKEQVPGASGELE